MKTHYFLSIFDGLNIFFLYMHHHDHYFSVMYCLLPDKKSKSYQKLQRINAKIHKKLNRYLNYNIILNDLELSIHDIIYLVSLPATVKTYQSIDFISIKCGGKTFT